MVNSRADTNQHQDNYNCNSPSRDTFWKHLLLLYTAINVIF
jgi:hypothetical protein